VAPVEISGFSHFFGFRLHASSQLPGPQLVKYCRKQKTRHVGMAFAKMRQRGLFLSRSFFGILLVLPTKKGDS